MIAIRKRPDNGRLVLEVGRRRGLTFYLSATQNSAGMVDVDVFCRPIGAFESLFSAVPAEGLSVAGMLAGYRRLEVPIQSAAAAQMGFLDGIAKKRPAGWAGGELNSGERRKQPPLVKGRRPMKTSKNSVQPTDADVLYHHGQAADDSAAAQLENREHTMTAIKKGAKPTDTKAKSEKPTKIGGKPEPKATAPKAEKPKAEKPKAEKPKAEKPKAAVTEKPAAEPGMKGRKRDEALYGAKVVATEKVAKEGSFYADLQAAAKKPIKLADLIVKLEELHPDTPDLKHHQKAAAKTVDGLKRMGYIALAA